MHVITDATDRTARPISKGGIVGAGWSRVAQTSSTSSLLSREFSSPDAGKFRACRLEVGDTAGWKLLETCATFRRTKSDRHFKSHPQQGSRLTWHAKVRFFFQKWVEAWKREGNRFLAGFGNLL